MIVSRLLRSLIDARNRKAFLEGGGVNGMDSVEGHFEGNPSLTDNEFHGAALVLYSFNNFLYFNKPM